jgi:hypothetical protein
MSHPLVDRILSGDAPDAAKQAAANGALPIPREDMIELWVCLRNDPNPDVKVACRESLSQIAEPEWIDLLPSYPFRAEVLDFALLVLGRNAKILESALRNRQAPVAAVEKVAAQATGNAIESILDNQTRLLQAPQIVVALLNNPAISVSQVRRIFDTAEQFFRDHTEITSILESKFGLKMGAAGGTLRVEAPQPAPAPTLPLPMAEEEEATKAILAELDVVPEPLEAGEVIPQALMDGASLSSEQTETLYEQILHMNIPKKVDLALKGNKEARGILIREANKTIQMAVVSSPKVTAEEAETFARMRHLPEEVFRKMALNKNFMKKYNIIKTLAFNPKVPRGLAMGIIKRLNEIDLKFLSKDKGVSELVRREAKRLLEPKRPN